MIKYEKHFIHDYVNEVKIVICILNMLIEIIF